MERVCFPDVYEGFKRATNEFLRTFIRSEHENRTVVSGHEILFYPSRIVFDWQQVLNTTGATIAILFDQELSRESLHCTPTDRNSQGLGFNERRKLRLNLFVSVPIDSSSSPAFESRLRAMRIFDSLNVLYSSCTPLLEQRGIYGSTLSAPIGGPPSEEFSTLKAELKCEVRYSYTKTGIN